MENTEQHQKHRPCQLLSVPYATPSCCPAFQLHFSNTLFMPLCPSGRVFPDSRPWGEWNRTPLLNVAEQAARQAGWRLLGSSANTEPPCFACLGCCGPFLRDETSAVRRHPSSHMDGCTWEAAFSIPSCCREQAFGVIMWGGSSTPLGRPHGYDRLLPDPCPARDDIREISTSVLLFTEVGHFMDREAGYQRIWRNRMIFQSITHAWLELLSPMSWALCHSSCSPYGSNMTVLLLDSTDATHTQQSWTSSPAAQATTAANRPQQPKWLGAAQRRLK